MSAEPRPLTFSEFIAWESRQESLHEYVDGRIVPLAGATVEHETIVPNLIHRLKAALETRPGRPCRVLGGRILVETRADRRGRYADVIVTCDERDLAPGNRVVRHPRVIFEVLSDSTAGDDRGEKLDEYTAIESIAEYVLVDSRRRWVSVERRVGELWTRYPMRDHLAIESLGISLALDDVYAGTPFADKTSPGDVAPEKPPPSESPAP